MQLGLLNPDMASQATINRSSGEFFIALTYFYEFHVVFDFLNENMPDLAGAIYSEDGRIATSQFGWICSLVVGANPNSGEVGRGARYRWLVLAVFSTSDSGTVSGAVI